ncbi:TIGR00730 family Rossman fold protein [Filobacillus milosensis]|uniref:Cytokinin riboside 5'-monophosphate phosphoribohydrolase n=1 Tax=Filobacillus milosensis TaxID=94137 RepID=A0A4Y8IN45_9BACI|nr:TIGR00730 family Rossman fold protein [Filobacillus milosensis]TFB21785.1 TIGR00730 family Rossman fold protein [Filobacillus milosensis]
MKSVAVFCGSRTGNHPEYMKQAKELGKKLAHEDIELVYGGAIVGLMGAVAEGVLENHGKVVGVIPEKLKTKEIMHTGLSKLHIVNTMHERKAMMSELSDAFIALPGGAGTLEEWFEVFTWAQIGYHQKPCALLNINNYYTPLLKLFDHMIDEGFADPHYKEFIIVESDAERLIDRARHFC